MMAIRCFKIMCNYYLDKGDFLNYAGCLCCIAQLYVTNNYTHEAIASYTAAADIYERENKNISGLKILSKIAGFYVYINEYIFAGEIFEKNAFIYTFKVTYKNIV